MANFFDAERERPQDEHDLGYGYAQTEAAGHVGRVDGREVAQHDVAEQGQEEYVPLLSFINNNEYDFFKKENATQNRKDADVPRKMRT